MLAGMLLYESFQFKLAYVAQLGEFQQRDWVVSLRSSGERSVVQQGRRTFGRLQHEQYVVS